MLRMLTDEDFNGRIVRGVFRLLPNLDCVRIQDIGLQSASDADILQAADDRRVLLTHDVKTMPVYAYNRTTSGEPMPGLIVCPQHLLIGSAIADVALLVGCGERGEWEGKVIYPPL